MSVRYHEYLNVRLVTGQTDPKTGVAHPTSGCIPAQEQKSGQFTTTGVNVLGDGSSKFAEEFKVDDFLYSASLNELRRIKAVSVDGTTMELDYAFSANIGVAEDVYRVPTQVYKSVYVKNTGASDALVQEVVLPTTEVDDRRFDLGCAPFTYDAQASTLMFHLSQ